MKRAIAVIILGLTLLSATEEIHKSKLLNPAPDSTIEEPVVFFEWEKIGDHGKYWLKVGTEEGLADIYDSVQYYIPKKVLRGLPISGKPLYVKLGTYINRHYEFTSYVIKTAEKASRLISPAYGFKIAKSDVDFEWEDIGADEYRLEVGTQKDKSDLALYQGTNTSFNLENTPQGKTIYVKISSKLGDKWVSKSYSFGAGSQAVIDTLILYSAGAKKLFPEIETRIAHHIETTNKAFRDSGLNVEINPVHIEYYEMNDEEHMNSTLVHAKYNEELTKLQEQYGADSLIIYRAIHSVQSNVSGIAYPNRYISKRLNIAVVGIDALGIVTAHELGHTMGLIHGYRGYFHGSFEYARGHGEQSKFITIMATSDTDFSSGNMIYKFSSPNLDCDGSPCGIAEGEYHEADAVKALRYAIPKVANYRVHIDNPDEKILNEALDALNKAKEAVANIQKELKDSKKAYIEQRAKFKLLREIYQTAKKEFAQARNNRMRGEITKDELAEIKSDLMEKRANLVESRADTKKLFNAWKDKKRVLQEAQAKVEKLEKDYLELVK